MAQIPIAQTIEGNTPLMVATQKDQYEIAELLIENKANIDEHEKLGGHVPIHWAIDFENTRFLKLFLDNGASIDFKSFEGATALIYQVSDKTREILEVIQFLLEHGADPIVEPKIGLTPPILATQYGKYETAKLLLKHGANPNAKIFRHAEYESARRD